MSICFVCVRSVDMERLGVMSQSKKERIIWVDWQTSECVCRLIYMRDSTPYLSLTNSEYISDVVIIRYGKDGKLFWILLRQRTKKIMVIWFILNRFYSIWKYRRECSSYLIRISLIDWYKNNDWWLRRKENTRIEKFCNVSIKRRQLLF